MPNKNQLFRMPAAQAMMERLKHLKPFDLPNTRLAGSIYDSDNAKIAVHAGTLPDIVEKMSQPFTRDEVAHVGKVYKQALDMQSVNNHEYQRALNALRVTQVDNYIRAMGNWASLFFEEIQLADDERPWFVNTHRTEVDVSYIAENGLPDVKQAVRPQKEVPIDLRLVSSEEVEYQIRDIYQGNIDAAAQATFDIAFDLMAKIEDLAKTTLHLGYGTFDTTNDEKLDRVYLANSYIETSNFPTTNELAGSSLTANSKLKITFVKEIEKYCQSWGNVFMDGPIMATGVVICPSSVVTDIFEGLDPTSDLSAPIAQQIMQSNYLSFSYGGKTWMLVGDPTINGNYIYPILNKRYGHCYKKSSWENEYVTPESPQERMRYNREKRSQMRLIGFATSSPWKVNICRYKFRDA